MKTLFYETRDFEFDYLLDKIPSNIEPYFIKTTLDECTFIDENYLDAEVISTFVGSKLTRDVLKKFKNLKFIFLRCVGYSNVDLQYCKSKNIYVFNTPNYGNSTVAEYAFCLILALSKKLIRAKNNIKDGIADSDNLMGMELESKTLGIIGLGAIGKKVQNIAYGFSMNVIAYDENPVGMYNFVEFDELLAKSDIISINCPLTSKTHHLINHQALSKMKQTSLLINCARGEIVDTEALYYALINKKIKGAALDVVECEQTLCENYPLCTKNKDIEFMCLKKFLFTQKLMQLDNVIITPHNAYNTYDANKRILDITISNIKNNIEKKDIDTGTKNLVLI